MANPQWPSSLPAYPLERNLEEAPPDNAIRTQMDAGPAKVRRRFTANVRDFQVTLYLTRSQVASLDAFFLTDVKGGSLVFDWKNPRTGSAAELRFVGKPRYFQRGDNLYEVMVQLEEMP